MTVHDLHTKLTELIASGCGNHQVLMEETYQVDDGDNHWDEMTRHVDIKLVVSSHTVWIEKELA